MNNILTLVQRINEETDYHAFFSFSGHVDLVSVYIIHQDTDYQGEAPLKKEYKADAYLDAVLYGCVSLDLIGKQLNDFLEVHALA